ncbi:MAG: Thiol peroxidase [Syntrophus sp. SKADARSKE-3]|nr:Thiol peroxidase [Syntrophus sp. SKADARSKE-3]
MIRYGNLVLVILVLFIFISCSTKVNIPVDKESVQPGTSVMREGQSVKLLGKTIAVGDHLPSVNLVDAATMKPVDLSKMKGEVMFLSIVPSIDTKVCEAQTHYLGEQGSKMPPTIKRITISRDTPFAQMRFAKEAKLTNIQYLSDYKQGDFARASGLLMDGLMLFARTVMLVDKDGVVRYIQVVPEITHLPDMETAFKKAEELAK